VSSAISSDSLPGMPSPRIEVPSEIVQKWQEIVNLLAEIIHVPAALVMKLEPPNIKVLVSSESSRNPYEKDEMACFDPGLYCERVIKSQQQLLIPDALQEEEWKSNPDVKLGMISYMGFPITWPDGHIFGTICVLDDKRNAYSEPYRKFLLQCRDVLQTDLKLLTSAIREGEERFRLVANAAPVLIWMSGPDKLCNYFNQPWLEFTGRPIELELGNGWAEGVHPEDLERCLDTYTKAFDGHESFKMEYRLRRHDREYRWVLDTAVPRFNRDGSFAGYIGSCIDITERKRAEEVLASVSGRLIEAQEQERARIARELHDDIVQRLVLVNIGLEGLQLDALDVPAEAGSRIKKWRDEIAKILDDVQSLSHELHSSRLEVLGMGAAMRAFCREFSDHQKVEIDFETHDLPRSLSPTVSLCLFRVLQEAVRNSNKHSGVRRIEVRSWGTSDEIHLTVRDSGAGFEIEAARNSRGLGLISMEERLKLVNGRFSIDSHPKGGTTIHARVRHRLQ
jgi:PAS domain S-box-containing protein